jgi:hypothetical protein
MTDTKNISTDDNPSKEQLEKEKEYIEELMAKSGMKPSDPNGTKKSRNACQIKITAFNQ